MNQRFFKTRKKNEQCHNKGGSAKMIGETLPGLPRYQYIRYHTLVMLERLLILILLRIYERNSSLGQKQTIFEMISERNNFGLEV